MADSDIKYPHIKVKLTGEDGNAFSIIARVSSAIEKSKGIEARESWVKEAMDSGNYDELLHFAMTTVNVV